MFHPILLVKDPMESIEYIISGLLIISGIWLLFAHPSFSTGLLDISLVVIVLGVVHIILGGVLAYSLLTTRWPFRYRARLNILFLSFVLYLFYAISNIFLYGTEDIDWVTLLAVALIMGRCHINLKRTE